MLTLLRMDLTFVRQFSSIKEAPTAGDIADFVVLTGANGAGKSQFLESIYRGALMTSDVAYSSGGPPQEIRFFRLGELLMSYPEPASLQSVTDIRTSLYEEFAKIMQEISSGQGPQAGQEENYVRNRLASGSFTHEYIRIIETMVGKPIHTFTKDDFIRNAPMLGVTDPFALPIVQLFLVYYRRRRSNSFARWQLENGETPSFTPLTSAEFIQRNGPPPWELMNQMLESIDLPYRFTEPNLDEDDRTEYEPLLRDTVSGTELKVDQLSSGEKTLLATALSLYSGTHLRDSILLPRVLLFDEPDATLHPSMIKTLLDVLRNTFVEEHKVRVIMTTHSPTTVALAPEEALYVMRRDQSPRIVKATRDEALTQLLVGIPTMSVSNDNRRQVFVEAKDDEECFQLLFTQQRAKINTPFSLEFIAAGSGSKGGCHEVIELVRGLRDRGNKVLGVLDRDLREEAPEGTVLVSGRYSIENLILDPVTIGLLLIRERKLDTVEAIGDDVPYHSLNQEQAQRLCDFVLDRIRNQVGEVRLASLDDGTTAQLEYDNGVKINAPRFVLDLRGHDWESVLRETFPQHQAASNRYKDNLKLAVIDLVFKDAPGWMPQDVRKLFDDLLSYPSSN